MHWFWWNRNNLSQKRRAKLWRRFCFLRLRRFISRQPVTTTAGSFGWPGFPSGSCFSWRSSIKLFNVWKSCSSRFLCRNSFAAVNTLLVFRLSEESETEQTWRRFRLLASRRSRPRRTSPNLPELTRKASLTSQVI